MEIIGLIFLGILSAYLIRRSSEFKRPKINVAEYGNVFEPGLTIPTTKPPLTYPEVSEIQSETVQEQAPENEIQSESEQEVPEETDEEDTEPLDPEPALHEDSFTPKQKPQQLQMDFN